MLTKFQLSDLQMVNHATQPVVLKFTADWCPGCRQLAPLFESVTEGYPDAVFYDVDVDEFLEFAQQGYHVMSIPTVVILKNGKEVDRVTAPEPSAEALKSFLDKNIANDD